MLSTYPLVQIIVALALTIAVIVAAVYRGREKGTVEASTIGSQLFDFLLMKRTATVWQVGLTYAASMVSALVFIGLPGLFYTHGVGSWLYFCLPVIFGVSALFWYGSRISQIARTCDAQSPFDVINYVYDSRWIGVASFFITAIFVVPVVAMQLVGIGRLMEPTGVPYEASIIGLIILFLFYTVFAGMRGDVRTDVFQGIMMVFGMMFVLGISIWLLIGQDRTLETVVAANPEHFGLPGPRSLFSIPATISVAVMFACLPLTHGHYLMRYMVAREDHYVAKAMPVAAVVIFLLYVCAAGIGLIGMAVVPGLDSGDQVSGTLLRMAEAPLGIIGGVIGGVIMAAILAAALSSVDSQFLALGASASRDVIATGLGVQLSERGTLRVIRLVMAFIGLCAVLMAMNPPPLIVQLSVFATSGTMVLVPTFVGAVVAKRPARAEYALASIIIGAVSFAALMFTGGVEGYGGWHPGIISGLVALLIYLFGLFMTRWAHRTD